MSKKTGKLTIEEINFIVSQKDKMTIEEIALALNRRPGAIADYVHSNIGVTDVQKVDLEAKYQLRSRPFYGLLQKQFTDEELKLLDHHYRKMYAQFKDDVFHTEEMQILDICKLEILCERILKSQGDSRKKIAELEYDIEMAKSEDRSSWDTNFISLLERQISALQISLKSMSDEYRDLMTRKSSALKDIKGTRDQRVKNIEDTKRTWTELVTALIEDKDFKKNVGLEMEKYRLAMEEEYHRLSTDIVYNNGVVDKPLLNSETVLKNE
jgi:hypothetical protein